MIEKLIIENFKIHKHLELMFKNLNILTGVNSSGKSSVIQSLLLLRQNKLAGNINTGLDLIGLLCRIGLGKDAICQFSNSDDLKFSIFDGGKIASWTFPVSNQYLEKSKIALSTSIDKIGNSSSLFNKDFHYISIARCAPRESYPLDTGMVEENRQISSRYGICDLVVHYLYHYGKEDVYEVPVELRCEGYEDIPDLLSQVSAWESLISGKVIVQPHKMGMSYALNYSYIKKGDVAEQSYSAYNVGSGLSYVLPIIVAILSSRKGGLVIIENPEIHLHERGQAQLAQLMAIAAQYGIQIIVETHSDTLINGVLVSSRRFEKTGVGIDKDNVAIYHFDKIQETQVSECHSIQIIGNGEVDKQPDGFFDQLTKDSNYLMGLDDAN